MPLLERIPTDAVCLDQSFWSQMRLRRHFLSARPFSALSLINLYNHLGLRIKQSSVLFLFLKKMEHFSVKHILFYFDFRIMYI